VELDPVDALLDDAPEAPERDPDVPNIEPKLLNQDVPAELAVEDEDAPEAEPREPYDDPAVP